MNLYNRIKARIVGWHADWHTGFSQYEEKFKEKLKPAEETEEKKAEEPPIRPETSAPAEQPRAYTEAVARRLAKEFKAEDAANGVTLPVRRIRTSFPHVRVVPEPIRQMQYPGPEERNLILNELSKAGWTELAIVDGDGLQFQGRFAGGALTRYEGYLAIRQTDGPLIEAKPGYRGEAGSWSQPVETIS